jgi:4-azaleucine resistance transporter AzlC
VGASYGAITVSQGFPWWTPTVMSVLVFGGASQFLFTGIVGAGGSAAAAVLAGLLINARHLPFGFALADVFGAKWHRRLAGSYVLVDEVVAFTLDQSDRRRQRWTYAAAGLSLYACWQAGSLVGALAGSVIDDTDRYGLDAAFPAIILALVLPSLRDPKSRNPALVGAVIAVASTPFLPVGLPVLLALTGLLWSVVRRDRGET